VANRIFNDFQGISIRVDGECYKFIGDTVSPPNTDPSEITGTFASCLECDLESTSSTSSESIENVSSESSSESSHISIESCVTPCTMEIVFQAIVIPDRLIVTDGTGVLLDTGFIAGTHRYTFNDVVCPVLVCVDATESGTQWHLAVNGCGFNIATLGGEGFHCWETGGLESSSSSDSYDCTLCNDTFPSNIDNWDVNTSMSNAPGIPYWNSGQMTWDSPGWTSYKTFVVNNSCLQGFTGEFDIGMKCWPGDWNRATGIAMLNEAKTTWTVRCYAEGGAGSKNWGGQNGGGSNWFDSQTDKYLRMTRDSSNIIRCYVRFTSIGSWSLLFTSTAVPGTLHVAGYGSTGLVDSYAGSHNWDDFYVWSC